jgi:hypothetical protein
LVEWKYTETAYGTCRGFTGGSREDRSRCETLDVTRDPSPERSCRLASGQRHCSRRYWEYLRAAGIQLGRFTGVQGCPFRGPFYQLMRQFVLAACLRKLCFPVQVDVLTICFAGNGELHRLPAQLQPLASNPSSGVMEAWNSILDDVSLLRQVTVEALMAQLDQLNGVNAEWRSYLRERYGV